MYLYEISEITAEDIMSTNIVIVMDDINLNKCIKLMSEKKIDKIFYIDNSIISIITREVVLNVLNLQSEKEYKNIFISQFAKRDILTVKPEEKAENVSKLIQKNKSDFVAVIDQNTPIGIIEYKNIVLNIHKKLKEINEFLLLTLNSIHEAVCIVDKYKIVRFWSKRAEELYDITAEKITGCKLENFFPNALLLEVVDKKKAIENIFLSPKEGSYVILSGIPLFNGKKFMGAVATDRDVTEVANIPLELQKANREFAGLKKKSGDDEQNYFRQILGESSIIKDKIEKAGRIAPTSSSIVITGETGTGKELFARSIHNASRREGEFIAVNCSAIPENLFESEMFGYVKGAFTGASPQGKEGKFKLANKGTLFLDEIGEMPLSMQAKLLRILQQQQYTPIGDQNPINIDVRVISATNNNLEKLIKEGRFREDLYYRLNVVKIHLPPLRERKEDIPVLINHFITEFCRDNNIYSIPEIRPEVIKVFMNYDWKGNIRELKNTISYLVLFSRKGKVTIESIPDYILENTSNQDNNHEIFDLKSCVRKTEISKITEVLKITGGNKSKAAKILNIPRSTLYYKMDLYNIKEPGNIKKLTT